MTLGPAVVIMRRFGRMSSVCSEWRAALWDDPHTMLSLLTKLSGDGTLSITRFSVAVALPESDLRSIYQPVGVKSASKRQSLLSLAFSNVLRDYGGWPALRKRVRVNARTLAQKLAAVKEATAARSAATSVSRVDTLHASLKSKIASWDIAKKESARLRGALRVSRDAESAIEAGISETLMRLSKERMSLSALQTTQVGATVHSLRKSDSTSVAEASQRIVRAWKSIAGISGREMDAESGVVDRSGKRPAVGGGVGSGGGSGSSHGGGGGGGSSSGGGCGGGGSSSVMHGSGGKQKQPPTPERLASRPASFSFPPPAKPPAKPVASKSFPARPPPPMLPPPPANAGTAEGLRERYAALEAQKRSRSIVQLSARDAPPPKPKRPRSF